MTTAPLQRTSFADPSRGGHPHRAYLQCRDAEAEADDDDDDNDDRVFLHVDGVCAYKVRVDFLDLEGEITGLEPCTPPAWLGYHQALEAAEALLSSDEGAEIDLCEREISTRTLGCWGARSLQIPRPVLLTQD